ncbi:IPT/TIG domain-containing protein [Actinoplanes siamensis]|uniref:IPT/TIG domain-containing protein n=1 Tax=Actinoplanes siamensis TaxID=1223317 RepID=A0A919TH31_9ACTN|nr:IPT/TIG domain-containing protein [Actinoplanes siamensis]GIF03681.1 hypothetical protein Asi03nite_12190 [Actinoplanes siamensis]
MLRRFGRAALASAVTTGLVLAGAAAPANAALTMTLNPGAGPSGGGNTVIGTVPSTTASPSPFAAGTTPTVQFQYAACATSARPVTQIAATGAVTTAGVLTVDPRDVTRITGTKIAFKVPSAEYPVGNGINTTGLTLAGTQTTAKWFVCVYDGDPSGPNTLLATGIYTVVPRPAITSIAPDTGPSAGGQTVTVNGTGFAATPITAAIGGVPLTNIKVSANGTSFTAVTGPRGGASGLALTVTTPAGTVSSLDPNNDGNGGDAIPYTYTNGIAIAPNTATPGSTVTVDVTGAGFSQLTFDTGADVPTSGHAHLFLVEGAYQASTNRGVAECGKVAVIGDTELVCTLDLSADRLSPATSAPVSGQPVPEGAYILTLVADGAPGSGAANPTIISSSSVFVVAAY